MAFFEPMHRNKPNITYLLTYFAYGAGEMPYPTHMAVTCTNLPFDVINQVRYFWYYHVNDYWSFVTGAQRPNGRGYGFFIIPLLLFLTPTTISRRYEIHDTQVNAYKYLDGKRLYPACRSLISIIGLQVRSEPWNGADRSKIY